MAVKSELRTRTELLVENLLDELMKSNIMTFLGWVEHCYCTKTLEDFLSFLEEEMVKALLIEMNADAYDDVMEEATNMYLDAPDLEETN